LLRTVFFERKVTVVRVLQVIAYFAPAFQYGGPPRTVLGLCRALQRVGIEVDVFTTTANGASDFSASAEGRLCEGIRVSYFRRRFPKRFFHSAGLAETLSACVGNYDLVHVHGLWNLAVWSAIRRIRRSSVPYIISPRGMLDAGSMAHQRWRKTIAYRVVERQNLEDAACLHATSAAELESLTLRGFRDKVFQLPNGFEAPLRAPIPCVFRIKLGISESAPLITYLGRIHPTKRLDLLAASFGRLRARYPEAHLVIAGPDDENYRRRIQPAFAQFAHSVTWTGELATEHKWSLLCDSTALVMCSDSESFGVSVVEAMASGVPVVVTRTCPWQQIEIAGCGFWVQQNPAAIADALHSVISDHSRAVEMGLRGKYLAYEQYEWNPIAIGMIARYRDILLGVKRDH
jgi:glycosyltransferase involved in cell wall biosynthesis